MVETGFATGTEPGPRRRVRHHLVAQQAFVQGAQGRCGLDPQFASDSGSELAVDLQRIGLSTGPVARQHREFVTVIPKRVPKTQLGADGVGLCDEIGFVAVQEDGGQLLHGRNAQIVQANPTGRDDVVADALVRKVTPPQAQGGPVCLNRLLRFGSADVAPGPLDRLGEVVLVEAGGLAWQDVARVVGEDRVLADLPPQPRNHRMHCCRRQGVGLISPDSVEKGGRRHGPSPTLDEDREQVSRPLTTRRLVGASGHGHERSQYSDLHLFMEPQLYTRAAGLSSHAGGLVDQVRRGHGRFPSSRETEIKWLSGSPPSRCARCACSQRRSRRCSGCTTARKVWI